MDFGHKLAASVDSRCSRLNTLVHEIDIKKWESELYRRISGPLVLIPVPVGFLFLFLPKMKK